MKEERASTNLLNLENHELTVELRKKKQECQNLEETNKSLESQMKTLQAQNWANRLGLFKSNSKTDGAEELKEELLVAQNELECKRNEHRKLTQFH